MKPPGKKNEKEQWYVVLNDGSKHKLNSTQELIELVKSNKFDLNETGHAEIVELENDIPRTQIFLRFLVDTKLIETYGVWR